MCGDIANTLVSGFGLIEFKSKRMNLWWRKKASQQPSCCGSGRIAIGMQCGEVLTRKLRLRNFNKPFHPTSITVSSGEYSIGGSTEGQSRGLTP